MKFSIPSLALAALVAPTLAQVVPGSVCGNFNPWWTELINSYRSISTITPVMIDTKGAVANVRLPRLRMFCALCLRTCGLLTNQYDREKDVTSINISAFAPGPVTCDFYTFVSFCSPFRQTLIQPGGRTAMETSTVSLPREESRGNNSASHSKLVAWPVPHSALAMELHKDIAYGVFQSQ